MIRTLLVVLTIALSLPARAAAQAPLQPTVPDWSTVRPPVLAEHATGGEVPVVIGGLSVTGLVIYDIATASASARAYNTLHPDGARKSPGNALLLSLAGTAVPFTIGAVTYERTLAYGGGLMLTGLVVGPSAGHLYAGRYRRGLVSAGLRAGLGLFTLYMYECCT